MYEAIFLLAAILFLAGLVTFRTFTQRLFNIHDAYYWGNYCPNIMLDTQGLKAIRLMLGNGQIFAVILSDDRGGYQAGPLSIQIVTGLRKDCTGGLKCQSSWVKYFGLKWKYQSGPIRKWLYSQQSKLRYGWINK